MRSTAIRQQLELFEPEDLPLSIMAQPKPFRTQLLKWVGNKQKQADSIIKFFPKQFDTYFEPFLGSGGVLGVLAPEKAVASDIFEPLVQIWQMLHSDKEELKRQYAERYALIVQLGKKAAYAKVLTSYNQEPNGADLLFLCRACYGGVVRFRKNDGFMSTPVGVHDPVSPDSFGIRTDIWHNRTRGTRFLHLDFAAAMNQAKCGDLIYCDPPYSDSQTILYGAQAFSLPRLFDTITSCKARGVYVVLSIDGTKYSGRKLCDIAIPEGLFEREEFVSVGRSMLKRFQMDGKTLEDHEVRDRLLLTF
ncbi:DNA adenine methylase [Crenothrix polyspora]|uniref:site-specific DNA-methyltransferase (adenine-specific) n=1 Tax=Crenothrix polyspora TaxID=360316 RepID=A0A1R4HK41_9GAMM|nr:DNA adenine methylase [Crenothrix polyspora]SJM96587.1 Site-specific DNA methylase [Crenothrix polyspora]